MVKEIEMTLEDGTTKVLTLGMMPNEDMEFPCDGAKEMLLVNYKENNR